MSSPPDERPASGPQVTDGWIDWQRFDEIAADCAWTAEELGRFYVDGTREHLAEIGAALEAGDREAVERIAHGCVGSSATCGIEGMVELFRQLERSAGSGNLAGGGDLLAQCGERLSGVAEAIADRGGD